MESIPIIVGLLLTAIGGFILFDTYNFRKIAKQVSGRIVGYESTESKSSTMFTPVVEFDHSGDTYSFKSSISSSNTPYMIGGKVPVLFLESDPHNSRIRTNVNYFIGVFCTVMGVIAITIGIVNFQTDPFSLIIAACILGYFLYKALQIKAKLNSDGIHTLDDMKALARKSRTIKNDSFKDDAVVNTDKNYRPSENLIKNQLDVNRKQLQPKWIAPTFILLGAVMLISGVYLGKERAEFFRVAHTTSGHVVSMESSVSDGSTVYYPIVKYKFPPNNQMVIFKHSTGSSHPKLRIGDKVKVLFNPKDKSDAMIDDGWMNWLGPGAIGGMGVIFLLVGIAASRRQRQLERSLTTYRNRSI